MTPFVVIPLIVVLAIASVTDLKRGLIPNQLIIFGFCAALFQQIYLRIDAPDSIGAAAAAALGNYTLGALLCGLPPLVLFWSGAMGGGDVKLLSVTGAFLGPSVGIEVEVYAFVLIALYAAAKLTYQGRLVSMLGNCLSLVRNPLLPKAKRLAIAPELMTTLRFAPSILLSTLLITSLRLIAR
jgi:prepilin peptidase CpaA